MGVLYQRTFIVPGRVRSLRCTPAMEGRCTISFLGDASGERRICVFRQRNGGYNISHRCLCCCFAQRSQYRKFINGAHSYLTQERIDQLKEIGFVFGAMDRSIYPLTSKYGRVVAEAGDAGNDDDDDVSGVEEKGADNDDDDVTLVDAEDADNDDDDGTLVDSDNTDSEDEQGPGFTKAGSGGSLKSAPETNPTSTMDEKPDISGDPNPTPDVTMSENFVIAGEPTFSPDVTTHENSATAGEPISSLDIASSQKIAIAGEPIPSLDVATSQEVANSREPILSPDVGSFDDHDKKPASKYEAMTDVIAESVNDGGQVEVLPASKNVGSCVSCQKDECACMGLNQLAAVATLADKLP
jgi:hypothetical protein